ncbi:MAG TPA: helix-turn-helix transcriptional regulator [Syntrophorhabdaceae bacterium]|nr:helix-turn-helix transcriptional regulator [Syntrophorhabdaceae bacterium]
MFKIARELQGIKQTELANFVGIKQQSIVPFENGKASLSHQTLCKMASFININEAFLSGDSPNPFSSDKLIKMKLPDRLLGGVDYTIIYFLSEKNEELDVVFLVAPLMVYERLLSRTALENPVFAIAIKDKDDNYFLFKRKSSDPLIGERELQIETKAIAEKNNHHISFRIHKIDEKLYEKIKKWSVENDDIKIFFSTNENKILTEKEWEIIQRIRKKKAEVEVSKLLDKL